MDGASISFATINNCHSTYLTILELTALVLYFALRFVILQNPGINDWKELATNFNIQT